MKVEHIYVIPNLDNILNSKKNTSQEDNKKPKYGDSAFLDYIQKIVNHPNYSGMPDPYGEKGDIQWESPSNRKSGKYKDTHQHRYEWWKNKARSIGINPESENAWISKTAKKIHPFGMKPCKKCGKEMELSYSYPNAHLFARIRKLDFFDDSFELSETEHIIELVSRLDYSFGKKIYNHLSSIFSTKFIQIPKIENNLEAWIEYLTQEYIPQESRMLSPGAMANPPDRFDGFHSFNRCCRSVADKGRTKENLKSYVTDRRVFEYWVDGDWLSADRLMGEVRSNDIFTNEPCLNDGDGGLHPLPCQADHIGPISLGFSHRPQFQLLCRFCNSAKNNRMYLSDVKTLLDEEKKGNTVISWFAKEAWNSLKGYVCDTETALRLSKILRDNRHTYMSLLENIIKEEHYTFLATLLHLDAADYIPSFEDLHTDNHLTSYKAITLIRRETKYSKIQKARRIRVALYALNDYTKKENRNAFVISNEKSDSLFEIARNELRKLKVHTCNVDNKIQSIISDQSSSEKEYINIIVDLEKAIKENSQKLNEIHNILSLGMNEVGKELHRQWMNERYVRSISDEVLD